MPEPEVSRRELKLEVNALRREAKDDRRALRLQAKEYERRLGELNNENARIRSFQNQSVSADKFEDYKSTQRTALDLALDRQDGRLKNLEDWKARATGIGVMLVLVSGAIGAAIMRGLTG